MAFTGPLEDRLAIRELMDAYGSAVTQRDEATWATLWAQGSHWSLSGLGDDIVLDGKETIVSSWVDMMAQFHGPADAPWAFSFVAVMGGIEVEGDRAKVLSYTVEAFDDGSGNTVHLKGQNDDLVVREDGAWRIKQRKWTLMPLEDHAAMSP